MKLNKLVLSLLLLFLFGCSSKDVLKLNDAIVKANDELRVASDSFNVKMDAVKNGDYTILEKERIAMIRFINKKIEEIESINADIPGGKVFKDAFIDYYNFEKDIYSEEYKEICSLKGEKAEEELIKIASKMQSKGEKEDRLEANIHTQQQNFAKKNNLKLQ